VTNPYAPPPGDGSSRPEKSAPGTPAPAVQTPPPPASPPRGPIPVPPARERPAPDPEAVRRTSRLVMHFGLLMLSALLVSSLTLPWQAASLMFAVAALVQGVRALRSAWTAGLRGALLPMLMVGIGGASMLVVGTIATLALWPVQMERQTCLHGALTISAQDGCDVAYRNSLDSVRKGLLTTSP
jgi:hypothetical protein